MKQLFLSVILISLLLTFSCGSDQPKSISNQKKVEEPDSLEAVKDLYKMNCRVCHGRNGNAGLGGAKKLGKSILSEQEAAEIIRNGKDKMQPFKAVLSEEEILALAAYIQGFKH